MHRGAIYINESLRELRPLGGDGIEVRTGADGLWVPVDVWLAKIHDLRRTQENELQSLANPLQSASKESKPSNIAAQPKGEFKNNDAAIPIMTVVEAADVIQSSLPSKIFMAKLIDYEVEPIASQPIRVQASIVKPNWDSADQSFSHNRALARPANSGRDKKSSGNLISKLASVAISVVLFLGIVGWKGYARFQRRHIGDSYQSDSRAGGIQSTSSEPSSGIIRTNPRRPMGVPSAAMRVEARVSLGSLFRPTFRTPQGDVNAGTAFAAKVPRANKTMIISAMHLFGPAGGLTADIPSIQLANEWQGLTLEEFRTGKMHRDLPIKPIVFPLAKPFPESSPSGDVAACILPEFYLFQSSALNLSSHVPSAGTRVWLAADVIGNTSLVHSAIVVGVDDGWLLYRFDEPNLQLQATSGAPVVDDSGNVIAVHAGGSEQNGQMIGIGTSVNKFYTSILGAL